MAEFKETAIARTAKRIFTNPFSDFNTFYETTTQFLEAELDFTRTAGDESYKTQIRYYYSTGFCPIISNIEAKTHYAYQDAGNLMFERCLITIACDWAERDETKDTWSRKFTCTNIVEGKEDNFTVTICKDHISINGFTYNETLDKVEAWADTQEAFA